jgi:acetyltransferase
MSIRNLDKIFLPRSIALIGASGKEGALGHIVLTKLREAGFKGEIWPVNPGYREISGLTCFKDIAALPGTPDLAIIATPAPTVPGLIGELGEAGTRAAVVITAGLGANEEGTLKRQMLEAARPHLMRIIGPNTLGLIVPPIGLNASFADPSVASGDLALISQSGAVIATMADWANSRNVGFSSMVSLGDMSDVDFGDLLDWFAADTRTRAILLYVESVTHPQKFMSAARSAARAKPVIVIKSGRHEEAAKAAASHTGALAGSDAVYDAAFRRAGLLRVFDLDELFSATETLGHVQPFRGDRLSVLTNGGGTGVLAVDTLADLGGKLAKLDEDTLKALDGVLPATWSRANPVDIIGDADEHRYSASLDHLLGDKNTDAVLVMNCPTALASSEKTAKAVADAIGAYRKAHPRAKPVFTCWLGGGAEEKARGIFEPLHIPNFSTPGDAVRGFVYLTRYAAAQEALIRMPPSLPGDFKPDKQRAQKTVQRAIEEGKKWLDSGDISEIFAAYDIPYVAPRFAATPEDAGKAARDLLQDHEACALKIVSPDIQHKSDVGGVKLNITSATAAEECARQMMEDISAAYPDKRIEGVSLEPLIDRPAARELILGLADDKLFGPVVLFGQGGTAVEVISDKALALPPLDLTLAHDLIEQTRVAKLLKSYRAQAAADIGAVALTLVKISQLAADIPEIRELDINPLLADEDGIIALDARMRVAEEKRRDRHGGNPRFAVHPYPSEWEGELELLDGSKIIARPVRPEDEMLYQEFFDHVTPDDARLRFFSPKPELSHKLIARFTQIDYNRAMAFVALDPETGALLGVVRLHADANGEIAEYAILVRSTIKGKGLGWALMTMIIDYARKTGLKKVYGDVLRANTVMLRMCGDLGFAQSFDTDDPAIVHVELDLREERPA